MKKNRGFTMIELLVVLVILGLLAGIVGPQFFWQGRFFESAHGGNTDKDVENGTSNVPLRCG